jgi:hypothetical protein
LGFLFLGFVFLHFEQIVCKGMGVNFIANARFGTNCRFGKL